MRRHRIPWCAFALAVTLLALAGCGGGGSSGSAESPPPSAPQSPPPATQPVISSLSVSPDALDLHRGEHAAFRATATYSDATTQDVTDSVRWTSSNPAQLTIDDHGAITAVDSGTVVVSAAHPSGLSDSSSVFVLPAEEPPPPSEPPPSEPPPASTGFVSLDTTAWDEASVRKVLHAFAFGGLASDAQIREWADMTPSAAIEQILTFAYTNERLSPAQDATAEHAASLEELQAFWSGSSPDNPMRWDMRRAYPTLVTAADGATYFVSPDNLKRTWTQAVRTRGINPFLHRVGFFLSNYQLSIRASLAGTGLMRSYYDEMLRDLTSGRPTTTVIGNAAKSPAVASRYVHRNNVFFSATRTFSGNDDFAREYFQLFFRLTGVTEDAQYHELTSIRNNARVLTGMQVDRTPNAYGSTHHGDWVLAPIQFTDHVDRENRPVLNLMRHHADCLEVLHQSVCGRTAAEKLDALSPQVARHPEVLANLPIFIVEHFADDALDEEKIATIRAGWLAAHDNLLSFLRAYATSTTFHRSDTVKFASAFTRNLALSATTTLNNAEIFLAQDADFPRRAMYEQGGDVFEPVHDVFGAQTGPEASVSAGLFKHAFDTAVDTQHGIGLLTVEYATDAGGANRARWDKDWRLAEPPAGYVVRDVAEWLWQRLLSDGGKNFDAVARSQVYALLGSGIDFGGAVPEMDPGSGARADDIYTTVQLSTDTRLLTLVDTLAARHLDLGSADPSVRCEANRRMNLAADFISMTPYSFAMEGR